MPGVLLLKTENHIAACSHLSVAPLQLTLNGGRGRVGGGQEDKEYHWWYLVFFQEYVKYLKTLPDE